MTTLTEEELEMMRSYFRDIVFERESIGHLANDEDAERDQADLDLIDSIKTHSDAVDMLEAFGNSIHRDSGEYLYQWARILDPKDGFKFEKYDDEQEDQEFREYLARTYDLTD